jgi:hypothetical protein
MSHGRPPQIKRLNIFCAVYREHCVRLGEMFGRAKTATAVMYILYLSVLFAVFGFAGPLSAQTHSPSVAPPNPTIAGCPVFPPDNIWNARVDRLPLDPKSQAYVRSIGSDKAMQADFASGTYGGGPIGIPFVTVPGNQEHVRIVFDYRNESDERNYPIPPDAPIEGGPNSKGDRHILIVDRDNCILWEIFQAHPQPDGSWKASSGAIFDLARNCLRPDGWTSADAAGLPVLPGLVRYEEVASGQIRHALRFSAPRTRNSAVWPARHFASRLSDPDLPPMGQRFRLKGGFSLSGFSPEAHVILRALQEYGMMLADNGGPWFVSGAPDEHWQDRVLDELKRVKGSDFEAVDVSDLFVAHHSAQALVQR